MPAAATAPPPRAGGQDDAPVSLSTRIAQLLRLCMWAYISNTLISTFIFPHKDAPQPSQVVDKAARPVTAEVPEKQNPFASFFPTLAPPKYQSAHPHFNIWHTSQLLDLHVYVDPDRTYSPNTDDMPVYASSALEYGDYSVILNHSVDLNIPYSVSHRNGSLYAHVYVTANGVSPCPEHPSFAEDHVIWRPVPLVQYLPFRKQPVHMSLFPNNPDDSSADPLPEQDRLEVSGSAPPMIVSYWSSNVTIHPVPLSDVLVPDKTPAFVVDWIDFLPNLKVHDPDMNVIGLSHKAPVWINDFWTLQEDLIPINSTTVTLPLHIEYRPVSMFKFNLLLSMKQSFNTQSSLMSAGMDSSSSSGLDDVKRMLRDTNPWYLGLTLLVSLLHSLFEFLAFKNDVAHWKTRKNVKGISVRSMFVNLAIQTVVFLYLLDNATDTSYVILVMNGIGLGIEVWKLSKATELRVDWTTKYFPRIRVQDKQSYISSQTKEFDDEAFKYMKWLMYPLLVVYAVYSLMYGKYKSWYSYILETLIGSIYAFGFLQLLPQLFINYRLKSVAHLNGRAITYKFLSTIVDDLFVFVIRMPTLQRMAAFRDDIVFVVYLYQRWIYRVDHSRVNEYGQGGVDDDEQQDQEDTKKTQ